jgi:hypothetical protein
MTCITTQQTALDRKQVVNAVVCVGTAPGVAVQACSWNQQEHFCVGVGLMNDHCHLHEDNW